MPKSSLAPAVRAIVFFGLMGAAVSSLTLGAGLQTPTDRSSTTVALAKGQQDHAEKRQLATADRGRSAVKHFAAYPSQPLPERKRSASSAG